ncbi:low-density lipoprotein receptor class A domain-containing protein 4 isoform X3 [Phacochoerus africanus]|uniref:low-density lipoprotein receptor class A domain-containing protein 4 isoform X3 n=1 Tax=Phacochoerus africanus TaxID=41426 RepID=UPI001FD89C3E|nr:low-density lipoprotein receptor class A domain-containing protein 4 isoform X3 [Phacochoerus africanus]
MEFPVRPAVGARPARPEPRLVRSRGSRGLGARSPRSVPAAHGGRRGPRGVLPAHSAPPRPAAAGPAWRGMGRAERPADCEAGAAAASGPPGDRRRGGGGCTRRTVSLPPPGAAGWPAGPGIPCEPARSRCRHNRLRVQGDWKGAESAGSSVGSRPLKPPGRAPPPPRHRPHGGRRLPALLSRRRSSSSASVTSNRRLQVGPFSRTEPVFKQLKRALICGGAAVLPQGRAKSQSSDPRGDPVAGHQPARGAVEQRAADQTPQALEDAACQEAQGSLPLSWAGWY